MGTTDPIVGSLPKPALGLGEDIVQKPVTQPSAFQKALGHALLNILSDGVGDVSDANQTFFVASLRQPGILEGQKVPQEVTNYQLFLKTDAVQFINRPTYSIADQPSYYELLFRYLRYIEPANPRKSVTTVPPNAEAIARARSELIRSEVQKDAAWEAARREYDPTKSATFIGTLLTDEAYMSSWNTEDAKQAVYKSLQSPEMDDVLSYLDIMKSANNRLVYKVGNTMPCIAISEDQVRSLGPLMASSKDIYYRPSYSMADYERQYNSWLDNQTLEDGPYSIEMTGVEQMTWKALGHPDLDTSQPVSVTGAVKQLWSQVNINMWFIGGPPASVDVDRGIWDVKGIRRLGQLADDAPSYLREPFCKTTKVLLAWGVRLELMLPLETIGSTVNAFISSLNVPFKKKGTVDNLYTFSAGGDTYPLLLAALATRI